MTGISDMADAVATRRALLAGALGAGTLGALAPALVESAAAAPIPTTPSSSYYLQVAGIPGDSPDRFHENWIELLTYSWGASSSLNPLVPVSGTPGSKSAPVDFIFVARSSIASPKLMLACAKGTAITKVTLDVVKAGAQTQRYLQIVLEDVRVASYNVAPSEGDGFPLDVGRLRYAEITHSFYPQRADGSLGPPVVGRFDFATNKAA
jgi:type VI secretion system secreted protein Hcp